MYDDPPSRSPFVRCAPVRWLRLFGAFCLACWCCLALFAACGLLAGALAGCTPATSGKTFGATPADVAAANAKSAPPGLAGAGDNAPALWELVADLSADLTGWGAAAVALGLAIASRQGLTAFGLHIALSGGILLVGAFALPAYGGWALGGLAVLAALALVGLWRSRNQPAAAASSLGDSFKKLWQRLTGRASTPSA